MTHSNTRAPAAPPASLRWAVMLLCAFALLHLLSLVPIPWDLSWKSTLIGSLILGPYVVVPRIAAAGLRARAQCADRFNAACRLMSGGCPGSVRSQ